MDGRKAAIQASGKTKKDFIAECRGQATAAPALAKDAPPAPPAPAPQAATPAPKAAAKTSARSQPLAAAPAGPGLGRVKTVCRNHRRVVISAAWRSAASFPGLTAL